MELLKNEEETFNGMLDGSHSCRREGKRMKSKKQRLCMKFRYTFG